MLIIKLFTLIWLNLFISIEADLIDPVSIKLINDSGHFQRLCQLILFTFLLTLSSSNFSPFNTLNAFDSLKLKRQPKTVNGPKALKFLAGKCYNLKQKKYRYQVCPFHNITQHELGSHLNKFEGVLGIWSGHWSIVNNTFQEMFYTDGDECSNSRLDRRVKVRHTCGDHEGLIKVLEPRMCDYEITFQTKAVCNSQALLVYPHLDDKLQNEWNQIKSLFDNDIITSKFYNKMLYKMLIESGLVKNISHQLSEQDNFNFKTLEECKLAYQQLAIQGLKKPEA